MKKDDTRPERISRLLIAHRDRPEGFWPWLDELKGKPADTKRANKFLLGCVLDYQMKAEVVWENARRLAEDILGDPEKLWNKIASVSEEEWMSKRTEYRLHRFPAAHKRVWRIATDVIDLYDGDARNIWTGRSPSAVQRRLDSIRVGEQIGRMVVGALMDTGQINGTGDVKADIHVCRVLGRSTQGRDLTPQRATALTRRIYPDNPWFLDQPLYRLGKNVCTALQPACQSCFLSDECIFYKTAVN